MGKKEHISDADQALFRAHVSDVKPLRDDRVQHRPTAPTPRRRQPDDDAGAQRVEDFSDPIDAEVLEGEESLLFVRAGVQHNTLRKLRRGQIPVAAELDLHGLRVEEARHELGHFLHHCRARRLQCVRIIHGKGYRSEQNRPVLKSMVNHWLRQLSEVLAFCSAQPADGGSGAIYVLLKRR